MENWVFFAAEEEGGVLDLGSAVAGVVLPVDVHGAVGVEAADEGGIRTGYRNTLQDWEYE